MKATVKWKGGMGFTGHLPSGHAVDMDAPESSGGRGAAPRPIELLLLALGGCTGMDVISILRKKRLAVDSMEIDVEAEQAEDYPRMLRRVTLTYRLAGQDLDEASVRRAMELSEEKYCSVGATLKAPVEVASRLELKSGRGKDSGLP